MALLTVTVRNSGIARTTPVALAQHRDGWLLVSVYGVTDWSRNLEAAGRGWVTIRGKKREVTARRPEPTEAGPLLRDSISTAPAMIRRKTAPYFSAGGDSEMADWEREAVAHPVFVLSIEPMGGVIEA
jgi:deazaflavin-dependent oxidoreductase (nitroreductase family)